jgi:hypothetical protein
VSVRLLVALGESLGEEVNASTACRFLDPSTYDLRIPFLLAVPLPGRSPYITDIASADEIFAIHVVIRSHELQVESIDIAIQDVLRQLHQLRTKRAYHLDTIAKCRGSISLARRAPDDVLALIFEHAAAGGWVNAPLVTSQVCAKWRRASFVPRVWSHVQISPARLKSRREDPSLAFEGPPLSTFRHDRRPSV